MIQPFIIFLLEIILLPLVTIRTILMVKNETRKASVIGGAEALVNVSALGIVFQDMSNVWNVVAYVLGFSCGLLLGGKLERKLALGYITYSISLLNNHEELTSRLRDEGFGVTVYEGEGMSTHRFRLDVLAKRTREKELLFTVNEVAPNSFWFSQEVRSFKGGFLSKNKKMRKQKNSL